MKFTIVSFLLSILIIPLASSVISGCSFPLVNPPPYTFSESWDPGPHVVSVWVDEGYDDDPAVASQLAHGVFNWNLWDLIDCSEIEFIGGVPTHFAPEVYEQSYTPPPLT